MDSFSSDFSPGLSYGLPAPDGGLWSPTQEKDACGIGFVADMQGRKTHRIVRKALDSVCRLTHRGAVSADARTGDGAGILTQIPYKLLRAGLGRGQGKLLKRDEDLALGMFFFPQDDAARHRAYRICEKVIDECDLIFLEWRLVPIDPEALGDSARESCPEIRQLLLARLEDMSDEAFDWHCYYIRKTMEKRIAEAGIDGFYIPSLSTRTVVYKGLVVGPQLDRFYLDLRDELFESAIALYHQRYSTNTFPTWFLAQPFRFLAHNGEINTLQGNVNWLRARELAQSSSIRGSHEKLVELRPIVQPGGSDSAALDNALESFVEGGRDILHSVLMMVPEAYEAVPEMSDDLRAFYQYHACLQDPWDGPAALSFTDGRIVGASLDRNGLRPARYQISDDGLFIVSSEVGTIDIDGARVLEKGRLGPGQIIALDTQTGKLMKNDEIKAHYAARAPYRQWVDDHLVRADEVGAGREVQGEIGTGREAPGAGNGGNPSREYSQNSATDGAAQNGDATSAQNGSANGATNGAIQNGAHADGNGAGEYSQAQPSAQRPEPSALFTQQKIFGYTKEDLDSIIKPMVKTAKEPMYSMGDDTPLAVLSEKPRLLYSYFRQRFAQVTNPPIDPLREKLVMSLSTSLGAEANIWSEEPDAARRIAFSTPLISDEQLRWLQSNVAGEGFQSVTLDATWPTDQGEDALRQACDRLHDEAVDAVKSGASILILSDRAASTRRAPIPTLMAVGAVHHHLIRCGVRTRTSIVCESGEARDEHQMACLLGYGAGAINPYLAFATIEHLAETGAIDGFEGDAADAIASYRKAIGNGLLKIMSKMGISTLASYQGAQIFEALGIGPRLIEECFTQTPSKIGGCEYSQIARDMLRLHETAFPPEEPKKPELEDFYYLRFRKDGEQHAFTPSWFKPFHKAVREDDYETQFKIYSGAVNAREKPIALRDLIEYSRTQTPIPLEEVEPVEALFKRFCTGAMSFGSLSREAHECLAIAMNRIGGKEQQRRRRRRYRALAP